MKRELPRKTIFVAAFLALSTAAASRPADQALIQVAGTGRVTAALLFDAGATVVRDVEDYLLATADATALTALDRRGIRYKILDAQVGDKTYYTVFPTARGSQTDLGAMSRVLAADRGGAVVEATPAEAEALAMAGYDIATVFLRPIRLPKPRDSITRQFCTEADSLIQAVVLSVSSAKIDFYVQRFQDFVTRWAGHDSCQAAANYIKSEFESFGIDSVYFHNFHTTYKDNVVAVIPGTAQPDKIVLIGGHYDSVSNTGFDEGPGADDNASGASCVLECARVLSNHEFDYTIIFIAFGAEEQGLKGSEAYAAAAEARGDDIVAMVNVDMIGYLEPGDVMDLDIIKNTSSQWLRDRVMDVAGTYVPELPLVDGSLPSGAGSDHMSFWAHGYDAIMFFEDTDDHSPYIHTLADTVGLSYNEPTLAWRSVKVAVALLADIAGPRTPPVAVVPANPAVRGAVALEQNVPNPFNPRTMIRFTVEPPGQEVTLEVFDVTGGLVRSLVRDEFVVGTRTLWWDGVNGKGNQVRSGVYWCRLRSADGQRVARKLVLVR